jgi:murein endopeptidase
VRLKCPADSPDCRPNEPATSIPDSCEALAGGWNTASTRTALAERLATESARYARDLPAACHLLPAPPTAAVPRPLTPGARRLSATLR